MKRDILHFYRQFRRHQFATYSKTGLHVNGVDQRQYAGGGAAYGWHAYAAYLSAKRHIHFRKTLTADIAASKKRSAAAKRGWKKRRASA